MTGKTTVSSDVTSKYNKLGEPYPQGFILETFKAVPGIGKIGWNASETPYQGIFSRPFGYGKQTSTDKTVGKICLKFSPNLTSSQYSTCNFHLSHYFI